MNWYTRSTVLEYVLWNSTTEPGLMYVISMYRVAAVFESFAQSKGITSQRISASPNLAAVWRTASLTNPPAGRYMVGVRPVAAAIASLALENWPAMSSVGMVAMLGCSQV